MFTVRTNHGWGWRVPEAPECPSFGSQAEALRYAKLRNQGTPHLEAWTASDEFKRQQNENNNTRTN